MQLDELKILLSDVEPQCILGCGSPGGSMAQALYLVHPALSVRPLSAVAEDIIHGLKRRKVFVAVDNNDYVGALVAAMVADTDIRNLIGGRKSHLVVESVASLSQKERDLIKHIVTEDVVVYSFDDNDKVGIDSLPTMVVSQCCVVPPASTNLVMYSGLSDCVDKLLSLNAIGVHAVCGASYESLMDIEMLYRLRGIPVHPSRRELCESTEFSALMALLLILSRRELEVSVVERTKMYLDLLNYAGFNYSEELLRKVDKDAKRFRPDFSYYVSMLYMVNGQHDEEAMDAFRFVAFVLKISSYVGGISLSSCIERVMLYVEQELHLELESGVFGRVVRLLPTSQLCPSDVFNSLRASEAWSFSRGVVLSETYADLVDVEYQSVCSLDCGSTVAGVVYGETDLSIKQFIVSMSLSQQLVEYIRYGHISEQEDVQNLMTIGLSPTTDMSRCALPDVVPLG
ncbi:hypothetical protein AB4254_09070 [Vibrio breoganii]